jgi:hypothetical protein
MFTFSAGSSCPREAQAEVGGHSGGLKAAEVPRQRSSLHERPENGKGARSEVHQRTASGGRVDTHHIHVRGAQKYL